MAIPSRVLGSGVNSLATISICGDGQDDIVAAGTSAGDATQLVSVYSSVDSASPGTGVKLPSTEAGAMVIVSNSSAHTVTVYPQTGSTINQTTSAAIAQNHASVFFAVTNTQWYSLNGTRT